jgi:hypothetical protein
MKSPEFNYSVTHDVWLVFKQGEGYWLQKFLKTGFGHVLMVYKDEYNWIFHDPHKLKLSSGICPYQVHEPVPRMLRKEGFNVIKITFFDRCTSKKIRHSRLNNCVSFIKYALGMRLYPITPYGLFKKLLRLTDKEKFKNGIRNVQLLS